MMLGSACLTAMIGMCVTIICLSKTFLLAQLWASAQEADSERNGHLHENTQIFLHTHKDDSDWRITVQLLKTSYDQRIKCICSLNCIYWFLTD